MSLRSSLALLFSCLTALSLGATDVVWPTTMDRASIRSPQDYLQPTVSGKTESGSFGMVREDGKRFHEGIDIRPAKTNADGEPLDLVLAAMDGQVAYLNPNVNGPYGRYVVLYHAAAEIPVYTLYAHLAKIEPSLKPAQPIRRGTPIGLMGHTSAGVSPITKDRSHLHFEVGLVLSTGFNLWYAAQAENKQSGNLHGLYNGQNLIGMDPLLVLGQPKVDVLAALRGQPTALTVGVRTSKIPDFVSRYPALVRGDVAHAAGWYVEFSWQGMPLRWTALDAQSPQLPAGRWRLLEVDQGQRSRLIQRKMLGADGRTPGELLTQSLEILLSTAR
ncbi:MAG: M23 family metallopeptidase [Opitutales bacterium]|nr:M23 family metallopeptidase [Opitutales bacterium]